MSHENPYKLGSTRKKPTDSQHQVGPDTNTTGGPPRAELPSTGKIVKKYVGYLAVMTAAAPVVLPAAARVAITKKTSNFPPTKFLKKLEADLIENIGEGNPESKIVRRIANDMGVQLMEPDQYSDLKAYSQERGRIVDNTLGQYVVYEDGRQKLLQESAASVAAREQSARDGAYDASPPPTVIPARDPSGYTDIIPNALHLGDDVRTTMTSLTKADRIPNAPPSTTPAHEPTGSVSTRPVITTRKTTYDRLSPLALSEILKKRPDVLEEIRQQLKTPNLNADLTNKDGLFGRRRGLTTTELREVKRIIGEVI